MNIVMLIIVLGLMLYGISIIARDIIKIIKHHRIHNDLMDIEFMIDNRNIDDRIALRRLETISRELEELK